MEYKTEGSLFFYILRRPEWHYLFGSDWLGRRINSKCIFAQRLSFAQRASKIIVQPQETLLSFSIGTFLLNYDVFCRKLKHGLHCAKANKNEGKISQWRLLCTRQLWCPIFKWLQQKMAAILLFVIQTSDNIVQISNTIWNLNHSIIKLLSTIWIPETSAYGKLL